MKDVFENYLKDVKYKDWDFNIRYDGDRLYLQISFWERDNTNPLSSEKMLQTSRKWMLSPHMTKSEVVQTTLKAVLTAEEHETREKFTYKNRAIFGPHFDVDIMADLCGNDIEDKRIALTMHTMLEKAA